MRRIHADWAAVSESLKAHELRTIKDYAETRGLQRDDWWRDSVAGAMAVALAIANSLRVQLDIGVIERHALMSIAIQLDLDIETLLRQQRLARRRRTGAIDAD